MPNTHKSLVAPGQLGIEHHGQPPSQIPPYEPLGNVVAHEIRVLYGVEILRDQVRTLQESGAPRQQIAEVGKQIEHLIGTTRQLARNPTDIRLRLSVAELGIARLAAKQLFTL